MVAQKQSTGLIVVGGAVVAFGVGVFLVQRRRTGSPGDQRTLAPSSTQPDDGGSGSGSEAGTTLLFSADSAFGTTIDLDPTLPLVPGMDTEGALSTTEATIVEAPEPLFASEEAPAPDRELVRQFFLFTNPRHAELHGHGEGPTEQELDSWVRIIGDFPNDVLAVEFGNWLDSGSA